VRFKGNPERIILAQLPRFNSKVVRFKVAMPIDRRTEHTSFNSKVVRFKAHRALQPRCVYRGFNSKVVRFKVRSLSSTSALTYVSIPKWCDSKALDASSIYFVPDGFQFQSGAIQRTLPLRSSFLTFVSIPKWCDSKLFKTVILWLITLFQFQSGAIQRIGTDVACCCENLRFNSKVVRFKGRIRLP